MKIATPLSDTMVALLKPLTAAGLAGLVDKGQGLLDLLEPDMRAELVGLLRPYRAKVALMIPWAVRQKIQEVRPDLMPVLIAPAGQTWLAQEVKTIKAAILEAP